MRWIGEAETHYSPDRHLCVSNSQMEGVSYVDVLANEHTAVQRPHNRLLSQGGAA